MWSLIPLGRFLKLNSLVALAAVASLGNAAFALDYERAKVTKILDGNEVFINDQEASLGSTATRGSTLRTGVSRARLLFSPTAIGLMNRDTKIRLGEKCFREDAGSVLVNGKLLACLGRDGGRTKIAGSRGTTYVLSRTEDSGYSLSVLAGEVIVSDDPGDFPQISEDYNIEDRYPKLNPSFGINLAPYANIYPSSGGSILGNISAFIPLAQKESRALLYSHTAASSDFDDVWGVTTELGYRWFNASNRSTTGVYLGYGGYDTPSCFNNMINTGGQWERSRWRFGVSTGLKLNDCDSGFNFGSVNLSIPISRLSATRTIHLGITPYLIWGGQIATPGSLYESDQEGGVSPGGAVSITVPASEALSFKVYGTIDSVYGGVIGGLLSYRIPFNGSFVRDPNADQLSAGVGGQTQTLQQMSTLPSNSPLAGKAQFPLPQQPVDVRLASTTLAAADAVSPLLKSWPSDSELITLGINDQKTVISQGYQARFSADGELIGDVVQMKPDQILMLLKENLQGQDPLPESRVIAEFANQQGILTTEIAEITGIVFHEVAGLPISQTVDAPFGINRPPTGQYVCQATDEAKKYAEQELRDDGDQHSADQVKDADRIYLGAGDKIANGWPATVSTSKAYRFANSSTCDELNSIIEGDDSYDGPDNPLELKELS